MRRTVTIDFETFSGVDLRKSSPWAYAEHPSTKVLCMGFQFHGGESTRLWRSGEYFPDDSLHIEAHNAEFERAIWETIMIPKYGFTKDVTWECTAARCAALALPRKLRDVNRVLGLEVEKDDKGRRLMLQMCKPRKPSKNNPATDWLGDEKKLSRLYAYCIQDVEAEVALSKRIRKLSVKEKEVWDVDQAINKRGICFDPEFVQSGMYLWELRQDELNLEIKKLTGGKVTKGTQHARFLKYVQEWDASIKSIEKKKFAHHLQREDMPSLLREALVLRSEVTKTSNAKYNALWRIQSKDGRARSMFMYHGASPGRWTGKFVQLHNLPTGKELNFVQEDIIALANFRDLELFNALYENPMAYLSACIRGAFVPGPGKTFACADYSAIEARVLLWLVNDPALELFRQGVDIYKHLASKIYWIPIEEVTDGQRQLGKQGILGLGFGMGAPKFVATCASYGIEIDEKLAKNVVDTYRKGYSSVPRFWYAINDAALRCIQTGQQQQCGRIRWGIKDDFLHCQLPSGRLLSYYKPHIAKTETPWGEMKDAVHFEGSISPAGFGLQHTYGGKLTENIVQAVARDILAEAMVRLEKEGFPIVMHVHDEVLCELPSAAGISVEREDEFETLVSQSPTWAPDLPIAIDTWYGDRYHK